VKLAATRKENPFSSTPYSKVISQLLRMRARKGKGEKTTAKGVLPNGGVNGLPIRTNHVFEGQYAASTSLQVRRSPFVTLVRALLFKYGGVAKLKSLETGQWGHGTWGSGKNHS